MRIKNEHQRVIPASPAVVGHLLDTLASNDDRLWPAGRWPRMRLDRPLGVGAAGGHSFVRYHVAAYQPGRRVVFEFDPPFPIQGHHRFEMEPVDDTHSNLHHMVEGRAHGRMTWQWILVVGPLHDALIEDALDRAEYWATGAVARPAQWSARVRILRGLTYRRAGRGV